VSLFVAVNLKPDVWPFIFLIFLTLLFFYPSLLYTLEQWWLMMMQMMMLSTFIAQNKCRLRFDLAS